jgi:hypothetical protein
MSPLHDEAKTFEGVAVFSMNVRRGRDDLGERVTRWLAANPDRVPVDTVVRQTSDRRFHCQTIVVFWRRISR